MNTKTPEEHQSGDRTIGTSRLKYAYHYRHNLLPTYIRPMLTSVSSMPTLVSQPTLAALDARVAIAAAHLPALAVVRRSYQAARMLLLTYGDQSELRVREQLAAGCANVYRRRHQNGIQCRCAANHSGMFAETLQARRLNARQSTSGCSISAQASDTAPASENIHELYRRYADSVRGW